MYKLIVAERNMLSSKSQSISLIQQGNKPLPHRKKGYFYNLIIEEVSNITSFIAKSLYN